MQETLPKGTHWTKKQFKKKLAKAKAYAEEHPCGFVLALDDWQEPKHRQKRVIVEGVRDALEDGGMALDQSWIPRRLESCSIYLRSDPALGISFAAITGDFQTFLGQASVHYGEDNYDSQFGLMIALYRAAYSYGKQNCAKWRS